jgi:predicted small metal-binding protein
MKTFSCGDVIPGCGGSVSAESEDGILAWAAVHAKAVHGVADFGPELAAKVRASVVSA